MLLFIRGKNVANFRLYSIICWSKLEMDETKKGLRREIFSERKGEWVQLSPVLTS